MVTCDWCGASRGCLQKVVDGKAFDICEPCWHFLWAKLSGKGRPAKEPREVEEYVEAEI